MLNAQDDPKRLVLEYPIKRNMPDNIRTNPDWSGIYKELENEMKGIYANPFGGFMYGKRAFDRYHNAVDNL
jgi:hypothetical protein